jgi:Domain of unknown function DUF29
MYDQDLVRWSEEQARALREAANAGGNAPIDWENVAEEIESLGRSDRRALASHIAIVIEHLLKLQASLSTMPARGWTDSVVRARREIGRLLDESPSLRQGVAGMIDQELPGARALVRLALKDYGEQPLIDLDQVNYTEDQVLGDWMPEQP